MTFFRVIGAPSAGTGEYDRTLPLLDPIEHEVTDRIDEPVDLYLCCGDQRLINKKVVVSPELTDETLAAGLTLFDAGVGLV